MNRPSRRGLLINSVLVSALVFLNACSHAQKSPQKATGGSLSVPQSQTVEKYVSRGNDMATIVLTLTGQKKADGNFLLSFKTPEEPAPSELTGTWKEISGAYHLVFKEAPPAGLDALFMFKINPSVKKESGNSVSFQKDASEITIWDISCRKVK